MGVLTNLLVIFLCIKCAFSDEALLDPCNHDDIECLNKAMESFFSKTSAGMPEYGIKQLEPVELEHVEYADPGSDIVMHFKNIKVKGMKNQKISDFKMDIDAKSVILQTSIEADIGSDLTVEFKDIAKFLSGTYKGKATTLATTTYSYDLKPNKDGVEYYDVGPDTISCEVTGVPEVSVDSQLADSIAKDPDAVARKADYEKRATEVRKRAICKIIAEAYKTVISNLRAAAKILPKTAFFKDLL